MPPVGRPTNKTGIGERAPINEIGSSYQGLGGYALTTSGHIAPWSQFIDEMEAVPELRWPGSIVTYNDMRRDTQLSALLTAVMYGITQLRYIVDPNGARDSLVKEVSEDLNVPIKGEDAEPKPRLKRRFSHAKHIFQALLAAIYGYAYFEQVGDIVDGKWRLRKLAIRPQNSIAEIMVAEDGGLVYIKQWTNTSPLPGDENKPIPVDRLCAYIFQQENNSWIGRSMLHDCFKPWVIKDRLVRIDTINHERAGGVPYAEAPMGATVDEIQSLDEMMQAFRIGETSGAAVPFGAKLNIARGTGSDVNASIHRCDEEMARRFLLMLANLAQGGQHVGSYGMAESFEDFFLLGQRAIANWYCDITNEHVIEDIADLNYGEDEELVPRLTWERSTEDSLGVEQLTSLVDSKIITVDEELENAIRYKYQYPKLQGKRPPDPAMVKLELDQQRQDAGGDGRSAPSRPKAPAPAKASAPFDWEQQEEQPEVMAMAQHEPVLVTVPNVPIIEAGVEYQLTTGPTTFTPEDLRDMVTAANEDPAIKQPRVKIGHIDPRYNTQPFDGTPAFGKFTELRLSENGMIVYADAVGTPKWLADIMPSAFPSRSIEGNWNVETQTGHTWRFVVTAVSALGVYWPGVMQLEDLPMYYTAERPADVVVDEEEQLVAASQPGGGPMKVLAAANLDDIRRSFYTEYVPQHQGDGAAMWWVRAVYTDPNELLVEDDNDGQLYMLSFESDSKGTVKFGTAEAVRVSYVKDKKKAAATMAVALSVDREVAASWQSRAESRPDSTAGGAMDPKQIRERLGLPEDATDEQVKGALKELNTAMGLPTAGEQSPAGTPVGNSVQEGRTGVGTGEATQPTQEQIDQARRESIGSGSTEDEQKAAAERAAALASLKLPDGMVIMDGETAKMLRDGAEAGLTLKKDSERQQRESLVAAAIGDGRIPPSRKEFWVKNLEADFDGFSQTLASLEKGLVPLQERGTGRGNEDQTDVEAEAKTVGDWTGRLFPETRGRRKMAEEVAASGAYPLIMSDAGHGEHNHLDGVLGR